MNTRNTIKGKRKSVLIPTPIVVPTFDEGQPPHDLGEFYRPFYERLIEEFYTLQDEMDQEQLVIYAIDCMYRINSTYVLWKGSVERYLAIRRRIFRIPGIYGLSYFILAHNHPNGDLTPSEEDKTLIRSFLSTKRFLRLQLIDYLIITDTGFNSAKVEKWL